MKIRNSDTDHRLLDMSRIALSILHSLYPLILPAVLGVWFRHIPVLQTGKPRLREFISHSQPTQLLRDLEEKWSYE